MPCLIFAQVNTKKRALTNKEIEEELARRGFKAVNKRENEASGSEPQPPSKRQRVSSVEEAKTIEEAKTLEAELRQFRKYGMKLISEALDISDQLEIIINKSLSKLAA